MYIADIIKAYIKDKQLNKALVAEKAGISQRKLTDFLGRRTYLFSSQAVSLMNALGVIFIDAENNEIIITGDESMRSVISTYNTLSYAELGRQANLTHGKISRYMNGNSQLYSYEIIALLIVLKIDCVMPTPAYTGPMDEAPYFIDPEEDFTHHINAPALRA